MPSRKTATTPSKNQPGIAGFMLAKKRSPPQRSSSPTNHTSSPDAKKPALDTLHPEATSNEPNPSLVTPQRDKPQDKMEATEDKDGDVVMENIQEDTEAENVPRSTKGEDKDVSQSSAPETTNQGKPEEIEDLVQQPTSIESENNSPNDPKTTEQTKSDATEEPKIKTTQSQVQKPTLKSSLKTTYRDTALKAAHLPDPAPIIPKWEAHQFACMFDIKMPKDKSKRTEYLSVELNKMIECLREFVKVYVRRYSDFHMPRDSDKKSWISKFDKKKVSDLTAFTFGFYYFQALREGTFRLLIQLILPVGTNIPELLINANGHKWAGKNNRSIRDIREQNLHSPKYVGWLFRSNYSMVGSNDLQTAFEERAGIHFGLTFKSVPLPNQGAYNKDTAVKAICISCNEDDQENAWQTLMKWYNSKTPKFPLGIPMMFIPSKDHPDIKNNPAAAQNISTLLDRQRIFLRDTDTVSCPHLAFPDEKIKGNRTLRHELMDLTALTMGEEKLGAKLFHSITRKVDPQGGEVYQFTYHNTVKREALSVISGMGQFLQKELKLDAEFYCHPHMINDEHDWDTSKRCVINPTTDYISNLAILAGPGDDQDSENQEEDEYSMDTKGRRESRRITGQDDEETIKNITQKKKARKKHTIPQDVSEDGSVHSEMSDLTKYSSSTRASKERKQLRHQLEDQQEELDAKDSEITRLRAQLERMNRSQHNTDALSASDNNSGESTSESHGKEDTEGNDVEVDSTTPIDDGEEEGWNFEEGELETSDTNEVEVTKVETPVKKKKLSNGLLFVFRGPPKQVQAVANHYTEQGKRTVQTLPYHDGTTTKVDLYKIVDSEKFRQAQEKESHSVKFAADTTVQEYDSNTGTLPQGLKSVITEKERQPPCTDRDESSSSSSEESDASHSSSGTGSVEHASDSGSSSASSSSSGSSSSGTQSDEPTNVRKDKQDTDGRKRPSLVTQETLDQARAIADAPNIEESAGDGPTPNV